MLQKNSATSAGPLLNSLHWLPVHSRINFKIATITYKSLHSQSPGYLASILHHYIPTRNLRSSNSLLLSPHPAKTNFGLHAFQSAAPNIWNKLPIDVKSACSISAFKGHLKTHYFQHTSWLVTWPRASDSLSDASACARYINSYCHCHCKNRVQLCWTLRSLHWLPIKQRIDFKIATLTFKLLNFGSPSYLSCLLKPYLPARALRSLGQRLLATPHAKTCIGSRAFRVAAPSVWNALPLHVRSSPSIDVFRRELKTHLFTMKS